MSPATTDRPSVKSKSPATPQRNGDGRQAMIEADNLSKFYGDFAATRDVTFTINRGEAQRSSVHTLELHFTQDVVIDDPSADIRVINAADNDDSSSS